jgi:hypothetical protein
MAGKCECYNNHSVLVEIDISARPCNITQYSNHEVRVKALSDSPVSGVVTSRTTAQDFKFLDSNNTPIDRVTGLISSLKQKEQQFINTLSRINAPTQDVNIPTVVNFRDDELDIDPGFPHTESCELTVHLK